MKRILLTGVIAVLGFAAMTLGVGGAGGADVAKLDPGQFGQTLFAQLPEPPYDPLVDPPGFFQVKPQEFDPRNYLGPGREAIINMVRRKLHVLNSAGKAEVIIKHWEKTGKPLPAFYTKGKAA